MGTAVLLRDRLRAEDGFTLLETLAVIAILGVVLAGLTQLFTSGANSEIDQSNRVQAQQQTRVALDKMRQEIHCATSVSPTSGSSWPTTSVTITLGSYCPTYTSSTSTVTWCTVANGSTYTLWRYQGNACSGTGTSWAQNIVATSSVVSGKIFRGYTTPTQPAMPAPLFTTASGSGLSAGTYYYVVDPVTAAGEQPGTEGAFTLSSAGAVTLDWTTECPPWGSTGPTITAFKIYRGSVSGAEQYLATVTEPTPPSSSNQCNTTTWTDTGSVAPSGSSPVSAQLAALNLDMPVRVHGSGSVGLAEITDSITLRNTPR